MARGIDYGMGTINIDHTTGIRYGVIPGNGDILQAWADSAEPDYGEPHCPKCGDECESAETRTTSSDPPGAWVQVDWIGQPEYAEGSEYYCESCRVGLDAEDVYGDEPIAYTLDSGEYQASQDSEGDVFVLKSPYYTRAEFCSPCAPGACYITNPCEDGEKAFCFDHDWFADGRAPYPVYRVADDAPVPAPTKGE